MTTKKPELQCPECKEKFNNAALMGRHRRYRHGVLGKAAQKNAVLGALKNIDHANPLQCPTCGFTAKMKSGLTWHMKAQHGIASPTPKQRKEMRLAKLTAKTAVIEAQPIHPNDNGQGYTDGISDALVALTSGRFIELCSNVAFEFDIPSRKFTQRVAAFIHSSQVR